MAEFDCQFSRSPGPGGQNVNKVNTKVLLKWHVESNRNLSDAVKHRFRQKFGNRINKAGQVVISSHRYRDQKRNLDDATGKLRLMILSVLKPPKSRKKTKPGRAAKQRRLDAKRRNSMTKQSRQTPRREE